MRKFKERVIKAIDNYQRKRAIKNHRKMWHWLAENPYRSKLNYLLKYGGPLLNGCYLCDYAARATARDGVEKSFMCVYCPLDWAGKECKGNNSLFNSWVDERLMPHIDEQKITEIALQIAELPEKVEK